MASFNQLAGLAHNGQSRKPKKVNLEQADGFQYLHCVLGHGTPFVTLGGTVQRRVLDQWFIGDNDASGVGTGVTCHPFQMLGGADELVDVVHIFV